MDNAYWLGRSDHALAMARIATTAESRLIHYELAGRYSLAAVRVPPPFMLPTKGPATPGEREALRIPAPPRYPTLHLVRAPDARSCPTLHAKDHSR